MANEWYTKVAATYGLEIGAPFLDRDLVAFLLGVPGEMQTWKGVPKSLLREAMRSVLPRSIAGRRWKADYTDKVNSGISQIYPEMRRSLQSKALVVEFGYVDRKTMMAELTRMEPQVQGPLFRSAPLLWSNRAGVVVAGVLRQPSGTRSFRMTGGIRSLPN